MFEASEVHFSIPVTIRVNSDLPESEISPYAKRTFQVFAQFEQHLSTFDPQGELHKLNRQRGRPMQVSESLFELLTFALKLANKSHGAFDPCVYDFLEAYGHYTDGIPNPQAIRALKNRRSGFREIILTPETKTVQLLPSQKIDLSALTKGYVIDLSAQILLSRFQHFLIDAAGDLLSIGNSHNKPYWEVPIHNPYHEIGGTVTLKVSNRGVATTTSFGEKETMVINPRTGEKANELISVTVVAPSAIRADSLCTTAFALGLHKGMALLEQEQGVEGIMITPDRTVLCTSGMKKYFT